MEPLEEFIRENKNSFDQFDAPDWEQVKPAIPAAPVKSRRLWVWYAAAAAVALIAVATVLFRPFKTRDQNTTVAAQQIPQLKQPILNDSAVHSDTSRPETAKKTEAKATDYYSMILQLKTQNPELYQNFMNDLESLEIQENKVKSQLAADPSNMYLLEALRYVELQKTNIIQKQIQIIQSFQSHNTHEKQL